MARHRRRGEMAVRHRARAQRREDLRVVFGVGGSKPGPDGLDVRAGGERQNATESQVVEAHLDEVYRRRAARSRLRRWIEPPPPLIHNPREPRNFPLGRWNLYVGGAGREVKGFVNLDLFPVPGVDIAADAERMPFRDGVFQVVECDAVLEHVRSPERVMAEIRRVLAPGGYVHLVTPF